MTAGSALEEGGVGVQRQERPVGQPERGHGEVALGRHVQDARARDGRGTAGGGGGVDVDDAIVAQHERVVVGAHAAGMDDDRERPTRAPRGCQPRREQ